MTPEQAADFVMCNAVQEQARLRTIQEKIADALKGADKQVDDARRAWAYAKANPDATMDEVEAATGVTIDQRKALNKWLASLKESE